MKKRMFFMLLAVFAFIALIGGFKFFQIKAAMAQGANYQPPPEAVTTVIAKPEDWNSTMSAIGSVAAVNGVTVSADLPGLVSEIDFTSGQSVNKGDVLLRLDMKQERAQLVAAQSQRDLSKLALDRTQGLVTKGIAAQQALDEAAAEHKQAEARVGEISATIERKTIRAPFSGVLGIRLINLGQYLSGGTPIVSLQSLRPAYVNFNVPQQDIASVRVGAPIEVTSDALGKSETGRISAFDSVIDEATRNARVQAIFDNSDGKMRPGMFVQAQLAHGTKLTVIPLPASAVSYAPFGDSIFIVEDVKGPKGSYRGVRQQFVKLGPTRGDQVAVLTGLKPGEEVVTSGVFKLRPGAAVTVNNSIQPGNNPKPNPENS